MSTQTKKELSAAWKKREVDAGVFAVRCDGSGDTWVGGWPDVDRVRNRIWFTLGLGSHPNRTLQEAWRVHGEGAFFFDVLERLEPCEPAWARDALLKERVASWREQLSGKAI